MKRLVSVLCFCVYLLICGCKREPELTRFYPVPDFSLTDQTGTTVTLADLKGKVWVADFIFTNCGGTCPMMTDKMRRLHDGLPAEIRMVSITVDSGRKTPQAPTAYVGE